MHSVCGTILVPALPLIPTPHCRGWFTSFWFILSSFSEEQTYLFSYSPTFFPWKVGLWASLLGFALLAGSRCLGREDVFRVPRSCVVSTVGRSTVNAAPPSVGHVLQGQTVLQGSPLCIDIFVLLKNIIKWVSRSTIAGSQEQRCFVSFCQVPFQNVVVVYSHQHGGMRGLVPQLHWCTILF